jgi:hypothetical protein
MHPGCRREWVVNRIIDPDKEARILSLLDQHGQVYTRIPFDLPTYRKIASREGSRCFHRLRYLINVNGARNRALERGRAIATWSLPLDGNCVFTADGWKRLAEKLGALRAHFALVPMYRLLDNSEYHGFSKSTRKAHEPQLAFHEMSTEAFDEARLWGGGDKLELIRRIRRKQGDTPMLGYVLRLFSGVAEGEGVYRVRGELRELAKQRLLRFTEEL